MEMGDVIVVPGSQEVDKESSTVVGQSDCFSLKYINSSISKNLRSG